jgi:PPOX class probable F420-dependent enzyme
VASISDPEVRAFLSQGTRTGKVAWVSASGQPLVTPVWFVVDDDTIIFTTDKDSSKGRAIVRDPRLTVCVDLEEPPYAFVQVQGVASVSDDIGDLVRGATAIAARYMGADKAEEFGKRNGVPGEYLVRLTPVKVSAAFNVTG